MGINNFIIAGIVILILIMGVGIYDGINKPISELNISQETKNISYEYLSETNNKTLADNLLIDVEPLEEPEDMFSNTTELHWRHMPLTYNYYNCSQSNVNKINNATDFITNRTESITFRFVKNQLETPDISFICMNERKMEYDNRYVTNTLAEAITYVYTDYPNIYAPSEVLIYSVDSCSYGRPVTEIHEILHLLGLEHPKYAYDNDIMNPERVGCKADITDEELEYLKGIYG